MFLAGLTLGAAAGDIRFVVHTLQEDLGRRIRRGSRVGHPRLLGLERQSELLSQFLPVLLLIA
jgi:hypothetical protein